MPQLKASKKDLRKSKRRLADNLKRKRKFRKFLKETRELVSKKKQAKAKELLPKVYKSLDKAAKQNTIHKNTAARYKSRITKLVNEGSK